MHLCTTTCEVRVAIGSDQQSLANSADFEQAEIEFDNVQKADPYRLEEVDIYSNMLYVMEKRAKLGKLAHDYAEIDRNRAEVCCLIGELQNTKTLT